MNAEQQCMLGRTNVHMVKWMCGISLRERKDTSDKLQNKQGIEPILDAIRRGTLKWMGHVFRNGVNNWVT